ncbi:MAG: hypothetical protein K8T25_09280 [Planctomycetia bacterium]|nr:hypothetical protein [Planctomycetia bacterium]
MIRIIIRGSAAVFRQDEDEEDEDDEEDQITDATILRSLAGLVYDKERFTDYLGGPDAENEVAAALEPGGIIQFGYVDGEDVLTAVTEYRSRRPLTDAELRLLVDYTMGQWSDGIGENWACSSPAKCGYAIMCLTPGSQVAKGYPSVQVLSE